MNQQPSRLDNILEVTGGFMWSVELSGNLSRRGVTLAESAMVRVGQLHDGDLLAEVRTAGVWEPDEIADITIVIESHAGQRLELEHCYRHDFDMDYSATPVQATALMFPGSIVLSPRVREVDGSPSRITFGLLNLEASGDIKLLFDTDRFTIRQVSDYDTQRHLLAHLRRPRVTYEATVTSDSNQLDSRQIFEDMDTLCRLLSLFRGTRIEWVYAQVHDQSGEIAGVQRRDPFARGFGQLSLIPTSPYALLEKFNQPAEPLGYAISRTIHVYRARRDVLRLPHLIEAVLDAMSETDFIELRGAKACVALEMILHAYERAELAPYDPDPLTYAQQRKVRKAIQPVARQAATDVGVPERLLSHIDQNSAGLFRMPLGERLQLLSDQLGAGLSQDEIRRVVKVRNRLVHTGGFLPPEALSNLPSERSEATLTQYLIVLDAVHRLLLKTIGYEGPYLDRRLGLDKTTTVTI